MIKKIHSAEINGLGKTLKSSLKVSMSEEQKLVDELSARAKSFKPVLEEKNGVWTYAWKIS